MLNAAAASVRDAVVSDVETDGDEEVTTAAFLRDEPTRSVVRANFAVAAADQRLMMLLADARDDADLRDRVTAAVERWVGVWCRRVDGDEPGIREQTQTATATEWAPLCGFQVWLSNPLVDYRPRDPRSVDARLAEALFMADTRRGLEPGFTPWSGTAVNGKRVPGGFDGSGRYDQDGKVLTQAPLPEQEPLPIDPPPAPTPPVEPKARSRWGRLIA